jgi:hypothetical protein
MKKLLKSKSEIALSYSEYKKIVEKLVSENKTSGTNQNESLSQYTKLNLSRMNRVEKTVVINSEFVKSIQKNQRKLIFLTISEAWCGDAAQNIPAINNIVKLNPLWEMKIVWRDENLDLMQHYQTNGANAIPKTIILNAETFEELAVWGARPAELQEIMNDYKKDNKGMSHDDIVSKIHLWYAHDKGQCLQREFEEILSGI